jgi:fatty acid desaturase
MTYRNIPPETYQQKIAALEQEIAQLKAENDNNIPEHSSKRGGVSVYKGTSVYAKMAVMITVVLVALGVAVYYIGVVRALALLWQLILYVIAGFALLLTAVILAPHFLYRKVRKNNP